MRNGSALDEIMLEEHRLYESMKNGSVLDKIILEEHRPYESMRNGSVLDKSYSRNTDFTSQRKKGE